MALTDAYSPIGDTPTATVGSALPHPPPPPDDAISPTAVLTPPSIAAAARDTAGGPTHVSLPDLDFACAARAAEIVVAASEPPLPPAERSVVEALLARALLGMIQLSLLTPEGLVYVAAILRRAVQRPTARGPTVAFLGRPNARRTAVAAASVVGKVHEDRYFSLGIMARALLPDHRQPPSSTLLATLEAAEWRLLEHIDFDVFLKLEEFEDVRDVLFGGGLALEDSAHEDHHSLELAL